MRLLHGARRRSESSRPIKPAGRPQFGDSTREVQGCLRAAAGAGRRPVGHAAAWRPPASATRKDSRPTRTSFTRRAGCRRSSILVEEIGADVNAKDHEGNTALHNAASRGDIEMILYLVSKGADVKADQSRGPDDRGHGQRSGAAHAAVPGSRRAARQARREEQQQVRVVLEAGLALGGAGQGEVREGALLTRREASPHPP